MAKGNMLLGYASGPIGDVVFKRVKGQQVQVPRVRKPANPRSAKQSIQRGRFAAAVKFFTRGNQNLFKFAFENKRQVESDYNAFMRENVRRAPAITKEAFGNYDYPVFAPFVMTHGTLPTLDNTISSGKAVVFLGVDAPSTLPTTVGELTSILVASDAFMAGDILTLVTINSSFDGTYPSAAGVGLGKPQWDIKQIILTAGSTETLADTLGMQAVNADGKLQLTDATGVTLLSGTYAAFVMVHSRNTAGGLKVSTQELVLNEAATTAYDASFAPDYKAEVVASWQADGTVDAQPEAILQGSIAYAPESSDSIDDYLSDALDSNETSIGIPFTVNKTVEASASPNDIDVVKLMPQTGVTISTDDIEIVGSYEHITTDKYESDGGIWISVAAATGSAGTHSYTINCKGLYAGKMNITVAE